jgi:hypothetical protein
MPFSAARESNFKSRFLVPLALRGSTLYMRPHVSGTEHVDFFEARRSRKPDSRLNTGDLSPFRLSLKVSGANVCWEIANHTFLIHKNPRAQLSRVTYAPLSNAVQLG